MKCIYCRADTSYAERRRNGGRCKGCQHGFAFEPKTDRLKVTDGMMQQAVKSVSGDGAVAFTERNLWYELNRRLIRKAPLGSLLSGLSGRAGRIALVLAALVFIAALLGGIVVLAVIVALGALGALLVVRAAGRSSRRGSHPRVGFDQFKSRYLTPWNSTHGSQPKLLPPLQPGRVAPPRPVEPDVTGYSFDRAVITDRAETAALLLANNFHFENNCAVLSVDGHPEDVFETVMTMLRRNPALTVFALHDATPAGCALARRLRDPGWFPEPGVRVIDLGLRPRQVQQLRLIRLRGTPAPLGADVRTTLSPEEVAWFESGERAELAALPPGRLMRSVFQGFAAANRAGSDGSTDGGGDGFFIWSYSDRADVYAADSFG